MLKRVWKALSGAAFGDPVASVGPAVVAPLTEESPDSESVAALLTAGLQSRAAGRTEEALARFEAAAALDPTSALAQFYLGNCAWEARDFDRAIQYFEKAREQNPKDGVVRLNLIKSRVARGDVEPALRELRELVAENPDVYATQASLLFTLHYSDQVKPDEIARTHREWGERFQKAVVGDPEGLLPIAEANPHRRLRIGYVSADFRRHSVAYFLEPILAGHDAERFETFCYSTLYHPDEVTDRLRGWAHHWRDVHDLSDSDAVTAIRSDRIDVLIDLCGHTWGARPGIFARRGAPIQMIYLGYPDTSGIPEMDFRIVDLQTDPPTKAEALHTERLLYLPRTQWCFRPDARMPRVGPLPALERGFIQFGSLNDFPKVSDTILHAWGRILAALPSATLRLMRVPPGEGRARVLATLAQYGVAPERVICADWFSEIAPGQQYSGVDIALDTYPFNGVTTTCECLWMGLPVVALAGSHSIARSGLSLLHVLELDELVSADIDGYVATAIGLARDLPRLENLRSGLRERMAQSELMNEAGFVRALEDLYRQAWQDRTTQ